MEIPRIVYHGTFWPDDIEQPSDRLKVDIGYICTSEFFGEAEYFSRLKRRWYVGKSGRLLIFGIDTDKLQAEVLKGVIPPDGIDPRALEDDWLMKREEEMKAERMRIREWRFPNIPLAAVTILSEDHLGAKPGMNIFDSRTFLP